MKTKEVQASVKRGAKLLDKQFPGWHLHVDLSEMDMACTHSCVLGQVFRAYDRYIIEVPDKYTEAANAPYNTPYYSFFGFDVPAVISINQSANYRKLHTAWVAQIEKRLNPQTGVL